MRVLSGATDAHRALPTGSTSKVVTSAAAYDLDPSLSLQLRRHRQSRFPTPQCSQRRQLAGVRHSLRRDDGAMLPPSCDPGYGQLGLMLGGDTLPTGHRFRLQPGAPDRHAQRHRSQFPTAADLGAGPGRPAGSGLLGHRPAERLRQRPPERPDRRRRRQRHGRHDPPPDGPDPRPQGSLVTQYQPTAWLQATTCLGGPGRALMEAVAEARHRRRPHLPVAGSPP